MVDNQKLFNKDFILIAIGQIISLFGNAILRFALPLHLLKITGSAAVFGSVMALSILPMIVLMPVGGVLADRVNKRNIMVALDVVASIVVFALSFFLKGNRIVVPITAVMMGLAVINCFYNPAVSSSMPLIVGRDNLLRANSITNGINSMSSLAGPLIGGLLYAMFGIQIIVYVTAACLLFSAIMELFITIPHTKKAAVGGVFSTIYHDFKSSLKYIVKENPILIQYVVVASMFNMLISPLMSIGLPTLVNLQLKLSEQYYAIAQSCFAIGSLGGAVMTAIYGPKVKENKRYVFLLAMCVLLLPIVAVLALGLGTKVVYATLLVCTVLISVSSSFISIIIISDVQRKCPIDYVGKVMSIVMAGCMCAQPIGNALYGVAYDFIPAQYIFLATAIALFGVTGLAKKVLNAQ